MIINKVTLKDIDIFEADISEIVEQAMEKVTSDLEANKENDKLSETIRNISTSIMDCFNTIFGEGTDIKIFGDKVNLIKCVSAFVELKTEMDRISKKEMDTLTNSLKKIKR